MFHQRPPNFNTSGLNELMKNPYFEQASCYILHWSNPEPYMINASNKLVQNSRQGLYKIGFTTRSLEKRINEIRKRWNASEDEMKIVGYIHLDLEEKAREIEYQIKTKLKSYQVTLFDTNKKFATEWFLAQYETTQYLSHRCKEEYREWDEIYQDKLFAEQINWEIDFEQDHTEDEEYVALVQIAMKKVGAKNLREFILMYMCEVI